MQVKRDHVRNNKTSLKVTFLDNKIVFAFKLYVFSIAIEVLCHKSLAGNTDAIWQEADQPRSQIASDLLKVMQGTTEEPGQEPSYAGL